MDGQYSMFDIHDETKPRRPCEYSFQRYIGQRVRLSNGITGKIAEINPYYTDVLGEDGNQYVGTPTTTAPIEEE